MSLDHIHWTIATAHPVSYLSSLSFDGYYWLWKYVNFRHLIIISTPHTRLPRCPRSDPVGLRHRLLPDTLRGDRLCPTFVGGNLFDWKDYCTNPGQAHYSCYNVIISRRGAHGKLRIAGGPAGWLPAPMAIPVFVRIATQSLALVRTRASVSVP